MGYWISQPLNYTKRQYWRIERETTRNGNQFADDELIAANDTEDLEYVMEKLKEEHIIWDLPVNLDEMKYRRWATQKLKSSRRKEHFALSRQSVTRSYIG